MDFVNRIGHYFHTAQTPKPKTPSTALEEKQQLLAHHIRIVTRGMSTGLCIYGSRGGLGKTRIVLQTLREELVQPIILNGHITPLSLYMNLYHNASGLIFLDDCDSLYRNLAALGILRSALWGQDDGRLVTYNSSQLDIPSSFTFTGQIIFTANILPRKNPAFDATLSRIDVIELDASNQEVIEMMMELASRGFEDMLRPQECHEVVAFIAEFASSRDLSLRLLEPSYRKVLYSREVGVDWRDLVRSQLEQIGRDADVARPQVNEMACLRQVLNAHASVKEQVEAWCQMTDKSRATFFRLKKKLN